MTLFIRRVIDYIKRRFVLVKKGTLVYVGLHRGNSFNTVFRKYKICYGFEANPEFYADLKKRFKKYPNVYIFNVAVTDKDGEIDFNISNNDGASSSVGHFKKEWGKFHSNKIKMKKTIRMPSINLLNFLELRKVDHIESYISDIQGFDLEVLKTLKPLIEKKRITNITCEVTKDEYGNIYKGLPDNSESGFHLLLNKNFERVAKGWGALNDGEFNEVPENWWEMDCKWKVKK